MSRPTRLPDYLAHILKAIDRIQRHTDGMDEAAFLGSDLVQDAVIRNLEVIGEAAKNIQTADPVFAQSHPEIPWQVMYAMRNRLTHGYDTVDVEMVWKTLQRDLPVLQQLLKDAQP